MSTWLAVAVMVVGTGPIQAPPVRTDVRRAYYSLRYAGENGPFRSKPAAVHAGLMALYSHAEAERWGCEWLIMLSRDRYGAWWYSTPKTGHEIAPNQCEVSYASTEIRRPGSTLVATAHTHPKGDLLPDPRPNPPDNQNAHPMFLVRSNGTIWYFAPRSTTPTEYGQMRPGAVEVFSTHDIGS